MVAEGIETQDQADWFRSLGCRLGQGYLYARPMAAPDLDRYLRARLAAVPGGGKGDGQARRETRSRLTKAGITDVLGVRRAAG
jgi:predicted signal transduction protein with EAL and GGDEF domain